MDGGALDAATRGVDDASRDHGAARNPHISDLVAAGLHVEALVQRAVALLARRELHRVGLALHGQLEAPVRATRGGIDHHPTTEHVGVDLVEAELGAALRTSRLDIGAGDGRTRLVDDAAHEDQARGLGGRGRRRLGLDFARDHRARFAARRGVGQVGGHELGLRPRRGGFGLHRRGLDGLGGSFPILRGSEQEEGARRDDHHHQTNQDLRVHRVAIVQKARLERH